MFKIKDTLIPGCFEIVPRLMEDKRGRFVKVFHQREYEKLGLQTSFLEEYYSFSEKSVVRGLHFQAPPSDHVKLVYCVHGEVKDVVVDIRKGSPTFGKTVSIILSAKNANLLYIPSGLAHGFCVTSKNAIMVYKVSTIYDPTRDNGIHWNSININWPTKNPIISTRDSEFPTLDKFQTPFKYDF